MLGYSFLYQPNLKYNIIYLFCSEIVATVFFFFVFDAIDMNIYGLLAHFDKIHISSEENKY